VHDVQGRNLTLADRSAEPQFFFARNQDSTHLDFWSDFLIYCHSSPAQLKIGIVDGVEAICDNVTVVQC